MDGVDVAVGPVLDEEGALVSGGELGAGAEGNAGGGAHSGVDDGAEGVGVVVGPLAGAVAPAVLAAAGDEVDADGSVPGGSGVPLHVGVVVEELAVGVEVDVVGVAESGGDDFPGFAVGVGARDPAAWGHDVGVVAAAVGVAGEEVVFGVVAEGGGGGEAVGVGEVREVSGDDVDLAVGSDAEAVGAVLAARGTLAVAAFEGE